MPRHMNVVVSAREQAKHLVEKVVHRSDNEPKVQAVTVAASRNDVAELFQDAERLSVVFGDVAQVDDTGFGKLAWRFHVVGGADVTWDCVVTSDDDGVRYAEVSPGSAVGITLALRAAPADRGTEVVARANPAGPELLTGPALFKALYRARALLQTGEVPTIEYNPSARTSRR